MPEAVYLAKQLRLRRFKDSEVKEAPFFGGKRAIVYRYDSLMTEVGGENVATWWLGSQEKVLESLARHRACCRLPERLRRGHNPFKHQHYITRMTCRPKAR
jgi:hypothetical protein